MNGQPPFGSVKVKVRHDANLGSAICRMLCAKRNKWRIDKYVQFQRQTFEIGTFRLTSAYSYYMGSNCPLVLHVLVDFRALILSEAHIN